MKNNLTNICISICSKTIKIGMNGLCWQYEEPWKYSKDGKKVNVLYIVNKIIRDLWKEEIENFKKGKLKAK